MAVLQVRWICLNSYYAIELLNQRERTYDSVILRWCCTLQTDVEPVASYVDTDWTNKVITRRICLIAWLGALSSSKAAKSKGVLHKERRPLPYFAVDCRPSSQVSIRIYSPHNFWSRISHLIAGVMTTCILSALSNCLCDIISLINCEMFMVFAPYYFVSMQSVCYQQCRISRVTLHFSSVAICSWFAHSGIADLLYDRLAVVSASFLACQV
jgi:hypothetical protein